jgi:K+-sensing histidine kinase KdpD
LSKRSRILVCVTQQKTCERLIREAARMCSEHNGEIHIIHVTKKGWNILDNKKEGEALEYLFGISKSVGASLVVIKSDDIPGAITDYAVKNNIDCLILGQSPAGEKRDDFRSVLAKSLHDREILVIT